MGHSQAEKNATHERIVQVAAKRFREAGLEGVGVADVMKEAGLTVGGFYRHFDSRDALVAEAIEAAFKASRAQLDAAAPAPSLEALLNAYLSEAHRDAPGTGCALAALAGDVGRSGAQPRSLYTGQVQRSLAAMTARFGDTADSRGRAILTLSAMLGALSLSRAVSDPVLSREILDSVRTALIAAAPPPRDTAAPEAGEPS